MNSLEADVLKDRVFVYVDDAGKIEIRIGYGDSGPPTLTITEDQDDWETFKREVEVLLNAITDGGYSG